MATNTVDMEKTPMTRFRKKLMLPENTTPYKIPGSPLMKKLGYGTGVAVYLLNGSVKKSKTSASPWAIKKCLKDKVNKTYSTRLAEEAEVLRGLSHPNVVGFRSYTKADDGRYNLAMEACTVSLGNLLEVRSTGGLGPLESLKINKMSYDVSKALNYLHNEALLMHGDIKSFNILIKGDFAVCKLCDFGVSIPVTKDGLIDFKKKPTADFVGTDLWNAPEVFEEDAELISTFSEIFSFGLVLYECIALCPPHTLEVVLADPKKSLDFNDTVSDDEEEDEIDYMVGTRPLFPEDMKLSEDYNDILEIFHMTTDEDPEKRPTAQKLEDIFKQLVDL